MHASTPGCTADIHAKGLQKTAVTGRRAAHLGPLEGLCEEPAVPAKQHAAGIGVRLCQAWYTKGTVSVSGAMVHEEYAENTVLETELHTC
jgi:hypothetical protein